MLRYVFLLLSWCRTTILLEKKHARPSFKEGKLWWCSIGMNVGVEIYGKGERFERPVVIFRKFNINSFLGIPLTTKPKVGKWYIPLEHASIKSCAILSQLRILDSKRLTEKMGTLSDDNFQKIKTMFLEAYTS